MKIGIFTALFHDRKIEDALDTIAAAGIKAVELGGGAYPGSRHLDDVGGVQKLIDDAGARKQLAKIVSDRGLIVDSISVHGNPLHPNQSIAQEHHDVFVNAVLLAEKLTADGIMENAVVNGFSGCPGDGPRAKNPNWVTCPWPDEYRDVLDWQWKKRVVPYWKQQNKFLKQHGVKFAIEAHPGFVVYNPETLLKLRKLAGDNIGCNFDPSHFWWQGIDPIAAARALGAAGAIYHVHAKDTRIDPYNSGINGNLDTKSYGDILNRSWVFRSVGYGHDEGWWKDFISNLLMIGYDNVLSIEHEDGLLSTTEGLKKAVETLSASIVTEKPGTMFWAKD
ncbi:MAG TPA: sugar phosphate isomerase/epimerase [Capsulimonadaceae bacterium]|jgi:sugar phosphate isomerase/epimerase